MNEMIAHIETEAVAIPASQGLLGGVWQNRIDG